MLSRRLSEWTLVSNGALSEGGFSLESCPFLGILVSLQLRLSTSQLTLSHSLIQSRVVHSLCNHDAKGVPSIFLAPRLLHLDLCDRNPVMVHMGAIETQLYSFFTP